MTNAEILDNLRRAGALIAEARRLMLPAAEALAYRKSMHMYGISGAFKGELGCYETGFDTVCMHSADVFGAHLPADTIGRNDRRSQEFDERWSNLLRQSGIVEISIQSML